MPNSSSKAMTSSTVSRLSKPRSLPKWEESVTFSGWTYTYACDKSNKKTKRTICQYMTYDITYSNRLRHAAVDRNILNKTYLFKFANDFQYTRCNIVTVGKPRLCTKRSIKRGLQRCVESASKGRRCRRRKPWASSCLSKRRWNSRSGSSQPQHCSHWLGDKSRCGPIMNKSANYQSNRRQSDGLVRRKGWVRHVVDFVGVVGSHWSSVQQLPCGEVCFFRL